MPPLWPDHENFLQATLYDGVRFCRFPARIAKFNNVWWSFLYRYNMRLKLPCEIASDMTLWFSAFPNFKENGRVFGFHWTFKSKKCFSFRGALPPDPPTRGCATAPCWGLWPQTPIIGSRSARSPCPPLYQVLNTPLSVSLVVFPFM